MATIKVKLPSLPAGKAAEAEMEAEYDDVPQAYQEPARLRHSHAQRLMEAGLMESLSEGAGDGCVDFRRDMPPKAHSSTRPLWVCPDGRIVLEAVSPVYAQALDLLVAISEPVSRTRHMQEYQLTQYSLYAGASMGLRTSDILSGLERFSKCNLPHEIHTMVYECTERYGKVKLILRSDRYYIECPRDGAAFDALLHDPQIAQMRVIREAAEEVPEALREAAGGAAGGAAGEGAGGAAGGAGGVGAAGSSLDAVASLVGASAFEEDEATFTRLEHRSFEVEPSKIKLVKERCNEIDWPLLEE
jgi:DNA excision repair protein ERCC-3